MLIILFSAMMPILVRMSLMPAEADGLGTSRLANRLRSDKTGQA